MDEEPSELQNAVSGPPRRQKPPDFVGIRRRSERAYEAWTSQEDEKLREEVAAGHGVAALAKSHARPASAIRSRIRQLGL